MSSPPSSPLAAETDLTQPVSPSLPLPSTSAESMVPTSETLSSDSSSSLSSTSPPSPQPFLGDASPTSVTRSLSTSQSSSLSNSSSTSYTEEGQQRHDSNTLSQIAESPPRANKIVAAAIPSESPTLLYSSSTPSPPSATVITTSPSSAASLFLTSSLSSLSSSVASLFRGSISPKDTSSMMGENSQVAPAPIAYYSLAEVALHNKPDDFWTIVNGRVYELTHYLHLHPGGFRLLFKNAGGDSTADFVGLRHSKKAVSILDNYWIGDLIGTKPMRTPRACLGSAIRQRQLPTSRLGDDLNVINSRRELSDRRDTPKLPRSSSSLTPSLSLQRNSAAEAEPCSSALAPLSSQPVQQRGQSEGPRPRIAKPPLQVSSYSWKNNTFVAQNSIYSQHDHHSTHNNSSSTPNPSADPPSNSSFIIRLSFPDPIDTDMTITDTISMTNIVESPTEHSNSSKLQVAAPSESTPRTFLVSESRVVSRNTKQLVLTPVQSPTSSATSLSSSFLFPVGSHILISFLDRITGDWIKRAYTPIVVDERSGAVTLMVKYYSQQHVASSYMHSLVVQDTVSVYGPFTSFAYTLSQHTPLILIGMGSGITPLYQLLQTVLQHQPPSSAQVGLLYACRNEQEIWLRKELDAMSSATVHIQYQLSRSTDPHYPHQGRIDASVIMQFLAHYYPHQFKAATADVHSSCVQPYPPTVLFCVCGSDQFNLHIHDVLTQLLHIPSSHIHLF